MRYELTEYEWTAIKPMLPNKSRGVPRVNDRRVLNGIFWVLRSAIHSTLATAIVFHIMPLLHERGVGASPPTKVSRLI